MLPLIIEPVFGAFYTNGISSDMVRGHWANDRDFKIVGGPYINRSDYLTYGMGRGVEFHSGALQVILEAQNG